MMSTREAGGGPVLGRRCRGGKEVHQTTCWTKLELANRSQKSWTVSDCFSFASPHSKKHRLVCGLFPLFQKRGRSTAWTSIHRNTTDPVAYVDPAVFTQYATIIRYLMLLIFSLGWPEDEEWRRLPPGLHNLFHPTIQDGSKWSKFGARGEHGDVFLFSNLGALWFSENRTLVLGEFDV